MGIIHTAKKNIKEEILRKKKTALLEEKKRNNADNLNITTTETLQVGAFHLIFHSIFNFHKNQ